MTYVYHSREIAAFLRKADFPLSVERRVIHDLWVESEHISRKYREDESLFRRHVRQEQRALLLKASERNKIIEIDPRFKVKTDQSEGNKIFQYFKMVRLELLYIEGKDYYRVRLRRLLKNFGYQRRSQKGMKRMNRYLKILSLEVFLKNRVPSDLFSAKLDDMIIIRIKRRKNGII